MIDPETLINPTKIAVPIFIGLILFEIALIAIGRTRGSYEAKDAATSIFMGLGSSISGALFGAIRVGALFWAYEARLMTIPTTLVAIILCFVLDDLRYYWSHRFGHRIRWFWADHVVHHSSQHYNLSTALRQAWMGSFTGLFLLRLPLVLIGFHPLVVIFCGGLNLLYQFWIHTETIGRLPKWFEAVMNTPSHHRVHHGRNPSYLDANYAGTLIIWDKLFGSFVPENDADPARFGLVKNLGTFNPLRIATHEFVGIAKDIIQPGLSMKQRLAYMFAQPGWCHDGSRKTSQQIKAEALKRLDASLKPDASIKTLPAE